MKIIKGFSNAIQSLRNDGLTPYQIFSLHDYLIKQAFNGIEDTETNINGLLDFSRDFEFRTLKIDEDILKIINNTSNNIFYRNLPTRFVFINNYFQYKKNTFLGIWIVDGEKSLGIAVFSQGGFHMYFQIFTDGIDFSQVPIEYLNITKYIATIVCNLLDLLDSKEDIDVEEIITTKEHNEKRVSKGKSIIPSKIVIRPKAHFRTYLDSFNSNHAKYSHKFLVRGHWRHFNSDRFKDKGSKKWIKPFFKGQGIYVKKDYEVHS